MSSSDANIFLLKPRSAAQVRPPAPLPTELTTPITVHEMDVECGLAPQPAPPTEQPTKALVVLRGWESGWKLFICMALGSIVSQMFYRWWDFGFANRFDVRCPPC